VDDEFLQSRMRADGKGPFGSNDATLVQAEDRSLGRLVELMRSDVVAIRDHWETRVWTRVYPNLFIVWSYRISHFLYLWRLKIPAILVMLWCHMFTGAEIKPSGIIGKSFLVIHPSGHSLGGGIICGDRLRLWGRCAIGSATIKGMPGAPRIGNDVQLGFGASVLGPVELGDEAFLGAHALVVRDLAPKERATAPTA
jgi:serine O-acetyltransferase